MGIDNFKAIILLYWTKFVDVNIYIIVRSFYSFWSEFIQTYHNVANRLFKSFYDAQNPQKISWKIIAIMFIEPAICLCTGGLHFDLWNILSMGRKMTIVEHYTVKKLRDSWICFDQTFLGLCKLFPARESMVSDIPAGDGNTAKPFLQCTGTHIENIVIMLIIRHMFVKQQNVGIYEHKICWYIGVTDK